MLLYAEPPTTVVSERPDLERPTTTAVVARHGSSVASTFLLGPGRTAVNLPGGAVTGVWPRRGFGLMASGPAGPASSLGVALDALLQILGEHRLKPVFATVADPEPYVRRGLHAYPMSEEGVLDLASFSLSGSRRASIRHSVTSARRAGLRVVPWCPDLASEVQRVSEAWVRAKRGPEAGFIVGRYEHEMPAPLDCRVALDADGSVVGFVTWRPYAGGRAYGLDLMRRRVDAPNPTMDLLIAESLLALAADGVEQASLGCVQLAHGALLERVYATRPLKRYKDKFAPTWQPRWCVVPSRVQVPTAALALFGASVPGGVRSMLRSGG